MAFGIADLTGDVIGCVSTDGYSYGERSTKRRHQPIIGRPTYRLHDSFPALEATVIFDMSPSQFSTFQSAWNGIISRGERTFTIRLMLSSPEVFNAQGEEYICAAIEPWSAQRSATGRWRVSMRLELPSNIIFADTLCDTIYGGPLLDLSPDDVYGGPIDGLSPDIIAPCDGVLN